MEIKTEGKIRREKFQIRNLHDTLILPLTGKPELVLWDADATLPGRLEQNRTPEKSAAQYLHSNRGIHRLQALEELQTRGMSDQAAMANVLRSALKDSFWACRETALEMLQDLDSLRRQGSAAEVLPLMNDTKPQVRKQALKFLARVQVSERRSILDRAITDSSLIVSTEALRQFLAREYPGTEDIRKKFENDTMNNYKGVLAGFYEAKEGQASYDWFIQSLQTSAGSDSYEIIRSFGQFLMKESDKSRLQQGTDFLFKLGIEGSRPEQVIGVYQVIRKMTFIADYKEKLKAIREKHRNDDFHEILEYLD